MAEQITVYTFDELTAEAQATVVENLRMTDEWRHHADTMAREDWYQEASQKLSDYGLPADDVFRSEYATYFYGSVNLKHDLITMLEDAYELPAVHAKLIKDFMNSTVGYLAADVLPGSRGHGRGYMRIEMESDAVYATADELATMKMGVDEGDEFEAEREAIESSLYDAFEALQEALKNFVDDMQQELHDDLQAHIDAYEEVDVVYDYIEWVYDYATFTEDGNMIEYRFRN